MGTMSSGRAVTYVAVFIAAAVITAAVAAVLVNISNRKMEAREFPLKVVAIEEGEIDPAVWGQNFPHQHDSFDRTREDYGKTRYGVSTRSPPRLLDVSSASSAPLVMTVRSMGHVGLPVRTISFCAAFQYGSRVCAFSNCSGVYTYCLLSLR